MIIGIGLGIISLLMIYFEFFAPGGILAFLAAVLALGGIGIFSYRDVEPLYILLYLIVYLILVVLTIRLALHKIKKNKNSLYAGEDQEGFLASTYDKNLIGKEGRSLTNLRPSGYIVIEKEKFQAVSESSYIKEGEPIKVIGGEGARLIVKKKEG